MKDGIRFGHTFGTSSYLSIIEGVILYNRARMFGALIAL